MKIQSLSVVIPSTCPNRCPFCISRLNITNKKFEKITNFKFFKIKDKLEFARDNGCNTLILTSTGEIFENLHYTKEILSANNDLKSPFKWIELQTSGYGIFENFEIINKIKQINWVSLSMVDPENFENNSKIMNSAVNLENTIDYLNTSGVNLRASINLTDVYKNYNRNDWKTLFKHLSCLGFKQVTFRILYGAASDSPQSEWIRNHGLTKEDKSFKLLNKYINENGSILGILPFGSKKISIDNLCTVIDNDCMSKNISSEDSYKYLILRPDGHLYTHWDNYSSILF